MRALNLQPLLGHCGSHDGVQGTRADPISVDMREIKGKLGAKKALVSQVASLSHSCQPCQETRTEQVEVSAPAYTTYRDKKTQKDSKPTTATFRVN